MMDKINIREKLTVASWRHMASWIFVIINPANGLSPDRRQSIIWTNDYLLRIEPLITGFEICILIWNFSLKCIYERHSQNICNFQG